MTITGAVYAKSANFHVSGNGNVIIQDRHLGENPLPKISGIVVDSSQSSGNGNITVELNANASKPDIRLVE